MIDILMATYNGEKYLKEQIESIVEQTFSDWKLIIHDDGSCDGTMEIVEEYTTRYPGKIVCIKDNIKTNGAKYNFYHLFQYSQAQYIMLCDQDDIWEKDKIKKAIYKMQKTEKIYGKDTPILGHTDLKVVNESLDIINTSFFDMQKLDYKKNTFAALLVQNNITGCTMIFNEKLKNMCQAMPKEAIMHDWWLGLIASAFGKVFYMSDKEILYRQHGNNTEGAKNLKSPSYLLKKFFNKSELKDSLLLTYNQARSFKKVFGRSLSEENVEILDAYISIENMGKLDRIKTIRKYGFMKSGLVRILGHIMYI